jgi:hypothetical protein
MLHTPTKPKVEVISGAWVVLPNGSRSGLLKFMQIVVASALSEARMAF